jgi:small subunit ribosomal protein S20
VANHPSALKRHRQSEKRRLRNRSIKTKLKNLVRQAREAVGTNNVEASTASFATAARALDKAVAKGVLHRNNASRKISRLARAASRVGASARN